MNLTDVLDELRIPYRSAGEDHHVTQGWVGTSCPTCCKGEDKYKLGIHQTWLACNCWTCGPQNLITALAELSGEHPAKDAKLLTGVEKEYVEDKRVKRGTLKLPPGVEDMLPVHQKYLKKRGFDPEKIAQLWGVKGIGLTSYLPWRLFIPINDMSGNLMSWTTRALGDARRRYIAAKPGEEIISAKHLLYGEQYARHCIIVVEGPTDAWRIGPGAVAVMGTSYTTEQMVRMGKYGKVAICFDREESAQKRAMQLKEELGMFPDCDAVRVVLDADDPGSATEEEIQELRNKFLD